MSNKLVSVVIPTFNAEETIQSAIRSIVQQDYPAIELIVIDDGSSDSTITKVWEMRQECNAKGIKINLIAQKNSGVSFARNRGVKESKGEYIAFLDADDQWLQSKLTQQVRHLESNEDLGLSFSRVNFFSADGRFRKASVLEKKEVCVEDCLRSNPTISPSTWVLRKAAFELIQGFQGHMTHAEDQEFLIRLLQKTHFSIEGLDEILCNYSTSVDGLSADVDAMYQGWLQLMDSFDEDDKVENENLTSATNKHFHHEYCLFLARRVMQTKQSSMIAWKYWLKAITSQSGNGWQGVTNKTMLLMRLSHYSLFQFLLTLKNADFIGKYFHREEAKTKEVNNA